MRTATLLYKQPRRVTSHKRRKQVRLHFWGSCQGPISPAPTPTAAETDAASVPHLLRVLIMPSDLCSPQYTPRLSPTAANEAPLWHPETLQRVLRMLIIACCLWSLQNRGYRSPSMANDACFTHVASSHLVLHTAPTGHIQAIISYRSINL